MSASIIESNSEPGIWRQVINQWILSCESLCENSHIIFSSTANMLVQFVSQCIDEFVGNQTLIKQCGAPNSIFNQLYTGSIVIYENVVGHIGIKVI